VFKYEDNEYFENFACAYNPAHANDTQHRGIGGGKDPASGLTHNKAINVLKGEIFDFYTIPSTITLMNLDSLSHEESN
jgi:hypothetical protein